MIHLRNWKKNTGNKEKEEIKKETKKESRKERKLTRIEKEQKTKLARLKLESEMIRRHMATTLNWMDIYKVEEDRVLIRRKNVQMTVMGIKLRPHNILLDEDKEQERWIETVRFCCNSFPEPIWFMFVQSPVNCDGHLGALRERENSEEDPAVSEMIRDDRKKILEFQQYNREKEFFLMIRDDDEMRLRKSLQDLHRLYYNAGFLPEVLNRKDYYNCISYLFENTTINDYVFSRGILSYLNMRYEYDPETDRYGIKDFTDNFEKYGEPELNIIPSQNLIERSKLAPESLRVTYSNLRLGDRFIRTMMVKNLPPTFMTALLSQYERDPNIKMFMRSAVSEIDLIRNLNRDYQITLRNLEKESNNMIRSNLEEALAGKQAYMDSIVRMKDKTKNISLLFQITADTEEILNARVNQFKSDMSSAGFQLSGCYFAQEESFKMCSPFFISSGLYSIIETNYSFQLNSGSEAALWPYIFDTLDDPEGLLLGYEKTNLGKVFLDPFYYVHKPADARLFNRVNGNFIFTGRAGAGKTTAMDLIIRDSIIKGVKVIWIDPENKNERMTKECGGTFIDWGMEGNLINIFDLKPISTDRDDEDFENTKWDTNRAIRAVTEDVKIVLHYLFPSLEEEAMNLVGPIIRMAYSSVGLKPDKYGKWPSFKGMGKDQMPTFSTFNECLLKAIAEYRGRPGHENRVRLLDSIAIRMNSILDEWSVYFNGHTTIEPSDSGRNIISFGTRKLFTVSEELQNALYHIMFNYSWSLCLDERYESEFIIDEAHTIILKGKTAKLVSQFVRRSRKYHNVMLIGTQEPRDFADDAVLTDGKAIFNNSAYKLIFGMNQDATEDLRKLERLNDNEAEYIMNFKQGDALLLCGDKRMPVRIIASTKERKQMGATY